MQDLHYRDKQIDVVNGGTKADLAAIYLESQTLQAQARAQFSFRLLLQVARMAYRIYTNLVHFRAMR